jgi:twitching motility protein PilU
MPCATPTPLNDLRLQIKLHGKESKDRDLSSGIGHLDIV